MVIRNIFMMRKGELGNMSSPCKKVSFIFFDILNLIFLILAYLFQTAIISDHGLCITLQEQFFWTVPVIRFITIIILYVLSNIIYLLCINLISHKLCKELFWQKNKHRVITFVLLFGFFLVNLWEFFKFDCSVF